MTGLAGTGFGLVGCVKGLVAVEATGCVRTGATAGVELGAGELVPVGDPRGEPIDAVGTAVEEEEEGVDEEGLVALVRVKAKVLAGGAVVAVAGLAAGLDGSALIGDTIGCEG